MPVSRYVSSLNKNAGPSRIESGIEKVVRLTAELELRNNRGVTIEVLALEVIKEFTTTCCHRDQATARVEVLAVVAKVLGEVLHTCCEECNLHLARTCVAVFLCEFFDDRCFVYDCVCNICNGIDFSLHDCWISSVRNR